MMDKVAKKNLQWDLNSPWAMGSDDYYTLKQYMCPQGQQTIVELGSGSSTFQFARDFPDALVVSLESAAQFLIQNNEKLGALGLSNASVVHAPILTQLILGGIYMTYDVSALSNDIAIDCLLVDGPVEALYPLGREAALYILFDRLKVGAVVGLDDYHRVSAKTTMKNWLAVYGDSLLLVEETPSFAVFRKVAECDGPQRTVTLAFKSYTTLAVALLKRIYRASLRQ